MARHSAHLAPVAPITTWSRSSPPAEAHWTETGVFWGQLGTAGGNRRGSFGALRRLHSPTTTVFSHTPPSRACCWQACCWAADASQSPTGIPSDDCVWLNSCRTRIPRPCAMPLHLQCYLNGQIGDSSFMLFQLFPVCFSFHFLQSLSLFPTGLPAPQLLAETGALPASVTSGRFTSQALITPPAPELRCISLEQYEEGFKTRQLPRENNNHQPGRWTSQAPDLRRRSSQFGTAILHLQHAQ